MRFAYDHGTSVSGATAVRALAVAPVVGLLFHSRDRRARARAAASRLVPMGLISASNTVTYFVAIDRMSPALVTLVIYVYPALAVGLALCNATFFACWLLLAQSALRQADAVTCFAAATGSSQVAVLVGSLVLANPQPGSRAAIVACLLGAGVVSTVIAFLLQLHGIARLGGAATALVTSLEIVTVVVLSAIVFDDPIGGGIVVGGLLVVTGAALAPLSVRPVPTRRPTTAPAEGL